MLFRITGKKILKKKDGIPSPVKEEERRKHLDHNLIKQLNEQSKDMQNNMSSYDFVRAFSNLSQILYLGNQYLSESKFWNITDQAQLDTILYTSFEVIRLSSILLQPYSPDLTTKILDFIGVPKD